MLIKTSWNYRLTLSLPPTMKSLPILAKNTEKQKLNFSRSVLLNMIFKVCLKYFAHDCRVE